MRIGFLAVVGLGLVSAPVNAAVIAGYDFSGYAGTETSGAVSTFDPNVAATSATRGSGFSNNVSSDQRTQNGLGIYPASTNLYDGSVSTATADGQYLSFTITPNAGFDASLTNLAFANDIQNGNGISGAISYSTDGTNYTALSPTTTGGGTGAQASAIITTYDLSQISALQNVSGELYFRLFNLSSSGSPYENGVFGQHASSNTSELYDIEVDGSTASATPEPASLGIAAVAALGLLGRRRRT